MPVILAADLLICDVLLASGKVPGLAPLVAEYNQAHPDYAIRPGSKSPISRKEYLRWQEVIGEHGEYSAGGSLANTLSTMKSLLGDRLAIRFIGGYGADFYGQVVAEQLGESGFTLLPSFLFTKPVETAVSFVMIDKKGERSIVTYPGTSAFYIRDYQLPESVVAESDIVFLQGSLWQKYGEDFAGQLYKLAVKHHKTIWLALPTHSNLGVEQKELIRSVIPDAKVVLANMEELKRLLMVDDEGEATRLLQAQLAPDACAFITHASDGAHVIRADSNKMVPPVPVDTLSIVNTLGAGDAAFAGFLAYSLAHPQQDEGAAQLAMQLAAATLCSKTARPEKIPPIFP